MSSHTSWEHEEVRSKTDSSPLSFPLSYVHRGFVILSLVSCFGFRFSCLVYSMQKYHLNVCFSTHVSKSRLNFYFTSNHCWMAELLGSLIITVAESGVCPVPPPAPGGLTVWLFGEAHAFRMFSPIRSFFLSVQTRTNGSLRATARDLKRRPRLMRTANRQSALCL